MEEIPAITRESVMVSTTGKLPVDPVEVRGYDFNDPEGVDYHKLLKMFKTTGFQATNFGNAVDEINKMIKKKLTPIPPKDSKEKETNLNRVGREMTNCSIFLGYTSNLISSGTRETIKYLVKNNMVDCLVTTAGGIEEDFIKCLAPTFLGDFALPGKQLRMGGINRTGNLLVPNDNYCKFEDWIMPILDKMLEEQKQESTIWTPSTMIARLGKEVDNPDSVYYWAYKWFSPALTDGSIGDMIYFHSYKNPGLILDIAGDVRKMNNQTVYAENTGMIILGGGLVKHHICNANMMRNGANFAVYVNTANEFDGSDAGARPDEAVSWGKIKMDATPVKIYGEASMVFPLLVAETFARTFKREE